VGIVVEGRKEGMKESYASISIIDRDDDVDVVSDSRLTW